MGSIEDRERLKEEYKKHYRSIKELRQKAVDAERMAKVNNALNRMNVDGLMDSFDEVLDKVRHKIALAEAKMEVYLESAEELNSDEVYRCEDEEFIRKQRSEETLQRIRAEMGIIQTDIKEQISALNEVDKSIGPKNQSANSVHNTGETKHNDAPGVKKTLGPAKQ